MWTRVVKSTKRISNWPLRYARVYTNLIWSKQHAKLLLRKCSLKCSHIFFCHSSKICSRVLSTPKIRQQEQNYISLPPFNQKPPHGWWMSLFPLRVTLKQPRAVNNRLYYFTPCFRAVGRVYKVASVSIHHLILNFYRIPTCAKQKIKNHNAHQVCRTETAYSACLEILIFHRFGNCDDAHAT